jgi:hypothetical protein
VLIHRPGPQRDSDDPATKAIYRAWDNPGVIVKALVICQERRFLRPVGTDVVNELAYNFRSFDWSPIHTYKVTPDDVIEYVKMEHNK